MYGASPLSKTRNVEVFYKALEWLTHYCLHLRDDKQLDIVHEAQETWWLPNVNGGSSINPDEPGLHSCLWGFIKQLSAQKLQR